MSLRTPSAPSSGYHLRSRYAPAGDQPAAIAQLTSGIQAGESHLVLQGVTGSGKTFTMANVIAKLNLPTLILTHNKTLGEQLYQEFRELLPTAAVHFLHSPYTAYRPESYQPETDLYRKKVAGRSPEADGELHAAIGAVNSRPDVVVIATCTALFDKAHLLADTKRPSLADVMAGIQKELKDRIRALKAAGQPLEAERLRKRVTADIRSLELDGYCRGMENYSYHLLGKSPGQRPHCFVDMLPSERLIIVDESHVSIPQFRALAPGVHSRVQNLVVHGFALPSALEGRPLRFDEFEAVAQPMIYVSATPSKYEIGQCDGNVVEQVVRPTGLLDPVVEVRPKPNQMQHLFSQIGACVESGDHALVATVNKASAEKVCKHLCDRGVSAKWLHEDLDLESRGEVFAGFRAGQSKVLVGVNLLREGLDLPQVSLVAIMDADRKGFLRTDSALIQLMGRAARNVNGRAILYADSYTDAMLLAIDETNWRRRTQQAHNDARGIVPETVKSNYQ